MTVLEIHETFGDSTDIKLVDEYGKELAVYDGKNSIPEKYNDATVLKGNAKLYYLELVVKEV